MEDNSSMMLFYRLYDFSPPERQYSPIVDEDTGELLVDNATLMTRASDLANQIHMRSTYYKHNVILSPIGDDFRLVLQTNEML